MASPSPSVSVAGLLAGMHEILGAEESSPTTNGCGGHTCACGEAETGELPELDARAVPHAIRHATIFGALDALGPGGGLVLVAPHDPLPLLDQLRVMVAEQTMEPLDLDKLVVSDSPGEAVSAMTDTAMKRFGLTYGPRLKPRWWLGERFGAWWRRRFGWKDA